MHISLIGMSEVGKTLWSKKLQENGYVHLCCDDVIEEKLGSFLKPLGYQGIEDVAKWLGQPYEDRYLENSGLYLEMEEEATNEILNKVEKMDKNKDVVVDTTGSVIYLSQQVLKRLKENTRVVYMDTPQHVQDEMYNLFLRFPKPLMWSDKFSKLDNEDIQKALARCYPLLLSSRTHSYKQLADVTIDYHTIRDEGFNTSDFIALIKRNYAISS